MNEEEYGKTTENTEEVKQNEETGAVSGLPISGQEAVEEAFSFAQEQEEEERARRRAAEEAARLAEAHRAAQQAAKERIRQARLKEEKEAQARQKKKKKATRLVCAVLAVFVLMAAVGYGASSLISTINTLRAQVSAQQTAQAETGSRNNAAAQGQTQTASEGGTVTEASSTIDRAEIKGGLSGALTDVSDIVEEVIRSVVAIEVSGTVTIGGRYGSRDYVTTGAGSGVIIGDNGTELWVVTNYHVIEDADTISIIFSDDSNVSAYVKGTSEENDLAVLGVQLGELSEGTREEIRAVVIGSSEELRLGEGVIAIGNALGWGQSVTVGVISGLKRSVTFEDGETMELLQISAAINPGNSGGALLNAAGELIGINNAKYSDTDVEGIGFAIPISSILDIMTELSLMEARVPVSAEDYPYMGITFKNYSSAYSEAHGMPAGAYVYEVGEDTPAAKAGILDDDIITALDGVKIGSYDDLVEELQYHGGGSQITVTVMRLISGSYQEVELELTLGFKQEYTR